MAKKNKEDMCPDCEITLDDEGNCPNCGWSKGSVSEEEKETTEDENVEEVEGDEEEEEF